MQVDLLSPAKDKYNLKFVEKTKLFNNLLFTENKHALT
jgi:hypothetical protein